MINIIAILIFILTAGCEKDTVYVYRNEPEQTPATRGEPERVIEQRTISIKKLTIEAADKSEFGEVLPSNSDYYWPSSQSPSPLKGKYYSFRLLYEYESNVDENIVLVHAAVSGSGYSESALGINNSSPTALEHNMPKGKGQGIFSDYIRISPNDIYKFDTLTIRVSIGSASGAFSVVSSEARVRIQVDAD